jgi:uncharacterized DUF497 family protein
MTRFQWDPEKAEANFRKHGIRFKVAAKVFDDPCVFIRQDRVVEDEPRWQAIGLVEGTAILLVAHSYYVEDAEEVIRIISARKADRTERKVYEQNRIHQSG